MPSAMSSPLSMSPPPCRRRSSGRGIEPPAGPRPVALIRGWSLVTAGPGARPLGDADQGRTEQAVGNRVAGLQHLGNGARRVLIGLDLVHRLMQIVVEPVARRRLHLGD